MDTLIDLATIFLVIEIIMSIVGIFIGIPVFIYVIRQLTKKKGVKKLGRYWRG